MVESKYGRVRDKLMADAHTVDSREKLADFVFSIIESIRYEELPDIFLNVYLRSLARALRKFYSENHEIGTAAKVRSEWQLMAEAIVGALTVA